ncbi:hypothetical protein [Acidithiobacillus sp.]
MAVGDIVARIFMGTSGLLENNAPGWSEVGAEQVRRPGEEMRNVIAIILNVFLSVGGFLVGTSLWRINFVLMFAVFIFILIPAANFVVSRIVHVNVLEKGF